MGRHDDEADFHLVVVEKIAIFGLCAKFQQGGDTNKKSGDVKKRTKGISYVLMSPNHSIPLSEGLEIVPWFCRFCIDCEGVEGGGEIRNRQGKIFDARSVQITTRIFKVLELIFPSDFLEKKTGRRGSPGPPNLVQGLSACADCSPWCC